MTVQEGELIKVNGRSEVVHPRDGKKFTLEELQMHVDGYVERVMLAPGKGAQHMYVDEDGKTKGRPFNRIATSLMSRHYAGQDSVVGDALIVRTRRT